MGDPQIPDPDPGPGQRGRDPRLAWFDVGGRYDAAAPDGVMTAVLEEVADFSGRPPTAATDSEVTGMLGRWQAAEAHAHARMLGCVRELVRRRAPKTHTVKVNGRHLQFPVRVYRGDLPAQWGIDVAHEVAAALKMSWQAAEALVTLGWELEARLPGTGRLLDAGLLTGLKAKIIVQELSVLPDELIGAAEELLSEEDLAADDMTPGRLRKLCQQVTDCVDPAGARQRREQAEREQARVKFFRSHGGAGSLFACGLPADEALRSESNVQKRALEYQDAGLDETMDLLRVLALVDTINGRGLDERVALWRAEQAARTGGQDPASDDTMSPEDGGNAEGGPSDPGGGGDPGDAGEDGGAGRDDDTGERNGPGGGEGPRGDGADTDGSSRNGTGEDGAGEDDANGNGDDGPGGGSGPGGGGSPGSGGGGEDSGAGGGGGGVPAGRPDPGLPSLVHLTLPLADLLDRRAQRPGEAPGYGSLDPALVRQLADAAIRSPGTRFCFTAVDDDGHAAAHGCARLIRAPAARGTRNTKKIRRTRRNGQTGPPGSPRDGPPATGWDLTPDTTRPGPPGGHGSWILTLPGGRRYRIDLHAIPLEHCDHAYETPGYRPGRLLRHLVQVRDGECTFTGCSRPARESDFEHATPYDKGGRTDFCNAGARSRRCHRVKQIPGWAVTQVQPGWHTWTVPSGRTYTKAPKRYPS
ncbi:MAG TPA: DUF222 domain-containing protein [Streptosporangiaceae bacterium]